MIIIPAIDLKNGQCVRLSQGHMDQSTVYSKDPLEVARRWESLGAVRLHVVDLDGAVSGLPANRDLITRMRSAVSMHIELGGGIRNYDTIKAYLDAGVDSIILGTAAVKDPGFLQDCCQVFPGKIIVGIDARDGMVAVQGWTEATQQTAIDFACQLDSTAVAAIIFTDISRDGMLTGPNIQSTAELARAVTIPVIASGGVSCIQDIKDLLAIREFGVTGVIIGRALYTGAVDLEACIKMIRETSPQC